MVDQLELEEIYRNEDWMGASSSDDELPNRDRGSPCLRDTVKKTMLPRNFDSLRKFFEPSENSGVNKYKSQSATSLSPKKEPSEALKAFREISYMKFKKIPSSDEESCCSKESHVDSEDSGLLKEGYVFERKCQPISKDTVNKKVKKWKKKASEQLEEVNKTYKHERSRNKETFSVPLGLEANRKIIEDPPDDSSSQSQSRASGKFNAEDEMDIRRNDEFMREVRRMLSSKKNPQALEKRSLPEEYSRLIHKKTAFVRNLDLQTQALTLMENGELVTENTETGADGDNREPATGIFDHLSQMVLKNKIVKNSKAAEQRNEIFDEKRCDGIENIEIDQKAGSRSNKKFEQKPGLSNELQVICDVQNQENIGHQFDLQIANQSDQFLDLPDLKDNVKSRLKKVENYLSSVSDVQFINPAVPEISELTTEREQSLFDSLAGEFLKNMTTGNNRRNKITRNDKKLLTIIVKRYIARGELARIDELMTSDLNEIALEVPPYENVTDREEFFLKKIIRQFIKRGMRDALEDLIAWIYYKLDARKTKQPEKQEDTIWGEKAVEDMVIAFKHSGKNPSMNKIVMHLVREHKKVYPGLNSRQIAAVKEMIKDLLIERFARMYLERTKTDVDRNSEPYALAVNVKNEFEMNSGMERLDVNGRYVAIKWKFASMEGESEQHHEINTEHETDQDSSVDDKSPCRAIEPQIPNRNMKAIEPEFQKDAKFVKGRLMDIVWNVQQTYHRQKVGKVNRTCSLVKKRSVTMIGEPIKGGKSNDLERKLDFEERRKQMREEHVKWLLEQKELLKDVKKKEALNIEKFTQALPKRLENMIAGRNRSLKQFDHKRDTDRHNPAPKLRKK